MKDFTILIYEDDEAWVKSFEYNLKAKFLLKGVNLKIIPKTDNDCVEQDLISCSPNVIMIDHDLGSFTGLEIIEVLDSMPDEDLRKVILVYYSGGETLEDLQETSKKFNCTVKCFTKEGDDLENALLAMIL